MYTYMCIYIYTHSTCVKFKGLLEYHGMSESLQPDTKRDAWKIDDIFRSWQWLPCPKITWQIWLSTGFCRFHKISKSSASPNGVKVLAIGSRFLLRWHWQWALRVSLTSKWTCMEPWSLTKCGAILSTRISLLPQSLKNVQIEMID